MGDASELDVALRFAAILEALGIEYTLGGSLASSLQGEPRSTNDVNFAVRLEEHHVTPLLARLGPDFVVDESSLRDAIRHGRSTQVYFLPFVLKIDVFVRGASAFDRTEFARRVPCESPSADASMPPVPKTTFCASSSGFGTAAACRIDSGGTCSESSGSRARFESLLPAAVGRAIGRRRSAGPGVRSGQPGLTPSRIIRATVCVSLSGVIRLAAPFCHRSGRSRLESGLGKGPGRPFVRWHTSCGVVRVALGLQSRNQRRSCRVDALLRVQGELVLLRRPVTIFNLSRTGVAVLSETRFRSGERLEFGLTVIGRPAVYVTSTAVHTQSRPDSPGLYLSGFEFRPERPGGAVPEAAIRHLIAAIAPAGFHV